MDYTSFLAQDYAVINPLQVSPDQYEDLETLRLMPRELEPHRRMMPLLVHLSALGTLQRMELADRAMHWGRNYDAPLFGALLQSTVAPYKVQMHWQRVMVRNRLHPWGRMWLRLHDPRVFRHLCWILDARQLAELMGPIDVWSWYDQNEQQWQQQSRPGVQRRDPRSQPFTTRQWAMLEEVEALNLCLKAMHRDPQCTQLATPQPARIMDYLLQARCVGLFDPNDRILHARQSHLYGPQVHQRKEYVKCLQQALSGEISYVGACAGLGALPLQEAPHA